MEEIISRLMDNHRVDEMALKRADAIELCMSLGSKFIEHFHKIYVGGLQDIDFNHHCHEMQAWYDKASSIVIKATKKSISNSELNDWFFTVGSSVDSLLNDSDEIDKYEIFMKKLDRGDSIKELLTDILR